MKPRQAAKAAGLKHYFTGKPCPKGHVCLRLVSTNGCTQCGLENFRRWAEENRERLRERDKARRESSPDAKAALQARRRARKLSATPQWLTDADHAQIQSVYALADALQAATGIPHEVDHIVPLQGKLVCGLHVPWNLQAIPMRDNRSKGNRIA